MHAFVNRAYARFLGATEELLVGRGDALPILEEDCDAYNAHIQALGVAPEAELDHRVLLPDGSVHWLHWMSRAICDADRVTVELQSVGRDITAQKGCDLSDALESGRS